MSDSKSGSRDGESATPVRTKRGDNKPYLLGVCALGIFISLAIVLYTAKQFARLSALDWLLFYVLIGFSGGILFFLIDPMRKQSFAWRKLVNLGGAAAIAAAFMFLAKQFTPDVSVGDPIETARSNLEDTIRGKWGSGIQVDVRNEESRLAVHLENWPISKKAAIARFIQTNDTNGLVGTEGIHFHGTGTMKIVLMDSPLQANVYDPQSRGTGATNADDIDVILRGPGLGSLVLVKETTSTIWDRYDYIKAMNPDIVIIHASCFSDNSDDEVERARFVTFLREIETMGDDSPHLLVYSRSFRRSGYLTGWLTQMKKAAPKLTSKLHTFYIRNGPQHFRTRGKNSNPFIMHDLRERISRIMEIIAYSSYSTDSSGSDGGAAN